MVRFRSIPSGTRVSVDCAAPPCFHPDVQVHRHPLHLANTAISWSFCTVSRDRWPMPKDKSVGRIYALDLTIFWSFITQNQAWWLWLRQSYTTESMCHNDAQVLTRLRQVLSKVDCAMIKQTWAMVGALQGIYFSELFHFTLKCKKTIFLRNYNGDFWTVSNSEQRCECSILSSGRQKAVLTANFACITWKTSERSYKQPDNRPSRFFAGPACDNHWYWWEELQYISHAVSSFSTELFVNRQHVYKDNAI